LGVELRGKLKNKGRGIEERCCVRTKRRVIGGRNGRKGGHFPTGNQWQKGLVERRESAQRRSVPLRGLGRKGAGIENISHYSGKRNPKKKDGRKRSRSAPEKRRYTLGERKGSGNKVENS